MTRESRYNGCYGRDRKRIKSGTEVATGDAAFDARLKIDGAPDDAVRALLAQARVRGAVDALFADESVVELRLLSLGDQGGAVRVELVLSRLKTLRDLAASVCALADAIDVR